MRPRLQWGDRRLRLERKESAPAADRVRVERSHSPVPTRRPIQPSSYRIGISARHPQSGGGVSIWSFEFSAVSALGLTPGRPSLYEFADAASRSRPPPPVLRGYRRARGLHDLAVPGAGGGSAAPGGG